MFYVLNQAEFDGIVKRMPYERECLLAAQYRTLHVLTMSHAERLASAITALGSFIQTPYELSDAVVRTLDTLNQMNSEFIGDCDKIRQRHNAAWLAKQAELGIPADQREAL